VRNQIEELNGKLETSGKIHILSRENLLPKKSCHTIIFGHKMSQHQVSISSTFYARVFHTKVLHAAFLRVKFEDTTECVNDLDFGRF